MKKIFSGQIINPSFYPDGFMKTANLKDLLKILKCNKEILIEDLQYDNNSVKEASLNKLTLFSL